MKLSVIGLRGFPLVEGGVEKHCESLYPKLDKDIKVTVYRRKPYVKSKEKFHQVNFIDLPSTRIKGLEPFIHSFLSTLDALFRKPDVVHYHNIGPAFFCPILKLRNIHTVLTYHSANYEHKKWGRFARCFLKFSESISLKYADNIIFVNRFQMEKYNEKIRKKSVFIPNGINNVVYSQNTNYLEDINVKPGRYILSVGRITQEKGFDTLIRAFKKANKNDFKLVIAGGVEFENNYMSSLKKLSKGEDVIFTGYVFGDNLNQLYSHAALFILSSNNEGFPLVLLEAMQYGLDVIVSDIPATHLVSLDENDYFDRGNYNMLAKKISERCKVIRKRKYDLSRFDWNEIAKNISNLYFKVAGFK